MVGAVLVIFAIGFTTLPASFSDETILVNQQIKIPIDFANTKSESQPFAYIVQITNDIGQVISVSYITGSLGAGQSLEQTLSYIPYEAGNYKVEKFLWSDLNTPTALTFEPVSNTITVVQSSEQQIQQPAQQTVQTELSVALSKSSYNENETIIISGTASSIIEYDAPVTIQIVNSNENIAAVVQVNPNSYGVYSYIVTSGGPLWSDSGIYQVLVNHGAEKTAKVFNYSGGTGVITPPPPPEPVVVVESAVSTTTIQNAQGSSTPGCEPDCFIPRVASVERNALITFENNDSAAHTSTAGTPSDGPSGIWDSSLIMNGQSYSIRLSNDGIYPYFCMVHPWMEGTIVVGEGNVTGIAPPPVPVPVIEEPVIEQLEPVIPSNTQHATVENAQGSSSPGCEPDCFSPSSISLKSAPAMVTFVNNDSAAHTSTAGTPADGPSGAWDSSMMMSGQSYTTPALAAGEYPYFCMVHPWMEGLVIVE